MCLCIDPMRFWHGISIIMVMHEPWTPFFLKCKLFLLDSGTCSHWGHFQVGRQHKSAKSTHRYNTVCMRSSYNGVDEILTWNGLMVIWAIEMNITFPKWKRFSFESVTCSIPSLWGKCSSADTTHTQNKFSHKYNTFCMWSCIESMTFWPGIMVMSSRDEHHFFGEKKTNDFNWILGHAQPSYWIHF